jgi:hypothetical protein
MNRLTNVLDGDTAIAYSRSRLPDPRTYRGDTYAVQIPIMHMGNLRHDPDVHQDTRIEYKTVTVFWYSVRKNIKTICGGVVPTVVWELHSIQQTSV